MRWNNRTQERTESPKIDKFIAEVNEVCKKHGFCIEHEDSQGAFIIEQYDDEHDFVWFGNAQAGVTVKDA